MREEVSCGIHYVNAPFEVLDTDMNVHAEYQQRARDHLEFVDEDLVAVAVIDLLLGPF